jgi:hypothetical protein
MSASDVLARFGTWALVKFVAALLVFVVLHLVRMPVLLLAVVLNGAMSRVDGAVTAAVSRDHTPGTGPVAGEGIR